MAKASYLFLKQKSFSGLLHRVSPSILFTLAIFLWSTAFVGIKVALQDYSPGSVALFRFSIASVCLLVPYLRLAKRQRIQARTFGLLVLIGPVGIAGYSVLLNQGELAISAGIASFIVSMTPLFSSLLAVLILKEIPSSRLFRGLGLSLLGLCLIAWGDISNLKYDLALFLVLMATFCGAIQSISQKIVLRNLSGLEVATFGTWLSVLVLLSYSYELASDFQKASWGTTLACVYLGIVPSFVAQWCWSHALANTKLIHANAYLFAMPILATVIGAVALHEIPSLLSIFGGFVAVCGAYLSVRQRSVPKVSPACIDSQD